MSDAERRWIELAAYAARVSRRVRIAGVPAYLIVEADILDPLRVRVEPGIVVLTAPPVRHEVLAGGEHMVIDARQEPVRVTLRGVEVRPEAEAVDPERAMLPLLHAVPSLQSCPMDAWDATDFAGWAAEHALGSTASLQAARFVLGAWGRAWDRTVDPGGHLDGGFDLFDAWGAWDGAHRAAARRWLDAPFF